MSVVPDVLVINLFGILAFWFVACNYMQGVLAVIVCLGVLICVYVHVRLPLHLCVCVCVCVCV